MAKVKVGFGAIIEHVNFAMLERVHRSGIDVQVGIELLEENPLFAKFEQGSERGCGQALA
jgi:hypothetical protein